MSQSRIALTFAAALAIGACGKKDQAPAGQTAASGATTTSAVQVADVDLGRAVGADKKITDKTDTFSPNDQIYASVHTTGTSPSTKLGARWTFENGTVVNESAETISPTGDAYTEFHVTKASAWPKGKYTLHVLLDGQEVKTADFSVQ